MNAIEAPGEVKGSRELSITTGEDEVGSVLVAISDSTNLVVLLRRPRLTLLSFTAR
jgi:hypothetical protein